MEQKEETKEEPKETGNSIPLSRSLSLLIVLGFLICRSSSDSTCSENVDIDLLREKLEKLNETLDKRVHHIFYCSRTHSQLDQVVQELKRSNFLMQRHGDISD